MGWHGKDKFKQLKKEKKKLGTLHEVQKRMRPSASPVIQELFFFRIQIQLQCFNREQKTIDKSSYRNTI